MTPQEQWSYKQRWIPQAYQAPFHSDLLWKVKHWLRDNVPQHQWHIREWTNVYEHTVWFKCLIHKHQFEAYFCD